MNMHCPATLSMLVLRFSKSVEHYRCYVDLHLRRRVRMRLSGSLLDVKRLVKHREFAGLVHKSRCYWQLEDFAIQFC